MLGVTGLLGSGFEELVHVLFGARDGAGTLELDGATLDVAALTPRKAMALGMGFVPADRPLDAVIGSLSVADNVTMTTLGRAPRPRSGSRAPGCAPPRPRSASATRSRRTGPSCRCRRSRAATSRRRCSASGCASTRPCCCSTSPPRASTSARASRSSPRCAPRPARGTAVVCASADYEELAGLCDRVLVLARGTVARELSGDELTKERIAEQVLTSTSAGDALATN